MKKNKIKREKSEYTVQAVSNAIDILELLGEYEHELSVSEIVHQLSLTKSNVSKLLSNLEYFGYVELNRYTGNYRLGVKIFQISQAYINKLNLIEVSQHSMQQLKDLLNESVYIGILNGKNIVYLDVIETDEPVRVRSRIGNVGPAYATAMGKAHLSALEDKEIDDLFGNKSFQKFTDNTIVSIKELKEEIKTVKENGYAIDNEEYEVGVCCVAAPIYDFLGKVIAAISISAPIERVDKSRLDAEIIPALLDSSKKLSVKFGYSAD